ncbi:MAG: gfo/Idh/MocA family oxidoreductase [Luteitalea sp.]|nr:gfo/Idh/MocA family oxidoreductase [Luteitalea sp.]
MTVHVGILGGGSISDTHARAASELPAVRVSAVCGANREKVERLAARHTATAYGDVEAFLSHRPLDLVAIGSPSGLHGDHIAAVAGQGLHALVEKPLEISTARVDRIIEVADRAGVEVGVFFQERCAPDLETLKGELAAGALGRLTLVTAHVKWYRPPEYYSQSRWRGTWALDGGGALMNQGIHTVDLLLWLLGDVARVFAHTRTGLHAIEVEDTVVAVLEFASGAIGTIEATTAAFPGFDRRIEITGTRGTIVVEHDRIVRRDVMDAPLRSPSVGEASESPSAVESQPGAGARSAVVADATPHRRVFENFLAALANGSRPRCDAREGRRSVAVVEAIYESARRGTAVDVGKVQA